MQPLTNLSPSIFLKMYIYVISNPAFEGWIKIGKANKVDSRLRGYQTYCPGRDFKLEFYIITKYAYLIEGYFKKYISGNGNEWFNCSPDRAKREIYIALKTIDYNIKHKIRPLWKKN